MLQRAQKGQLQSRVLRARASTLDWLRTMQWPEAAPGAMRFSNAHDPDLWPGMLLPGTYNGVHCLSLLGALEDEGPHDHALLVDWLDSQRNAGGVFTIAGMDDGSVFKKPDILETWNYINFHITNYSLGALEMLDGDRVPRLDFVKNWLDPAVMENWLNKRDWSDPWQEGNNIVNLASFLFLQEQSGAAEHRIKARAALKIMVLWLEAKQNPSTGFWGEDRDYNGGELLNAMAGAMHAFHIWYKLGRTLPHQTNAIDYVLSLDPAMVMGACLDVDCVDLLYHGARLNGHRQDEIQAWMTRKLVVLLDSQMDDGGFCDITAGTLHFDGWVRGYREDQGQSNTFSTWFRWIAIAMISDLLWPGWRNWRFRRMIGIGYCRTNRDTE